MYLFAKQIIKIFIEFSRFFRVVFLDNEYLKKPSLRSASYKVKRMVLKDYLRILV